MCRDIAVAVGITLAVWSTAAAAQSRPPSNLQVLPPETRPGEIIAIMKGFTQALGVRCQFCHSYSGTNPDLLENFDFAADTVPAKLTARRMITASRRINDDVLKGIVQPSPDGQEKVTCYSCHRGERTPLTARPPR
jgi:hypothetical protein